MDVLARRLYPRATGDLAEEDHPDATGYREIARAVLRVLPRSLAPARTAS